MEKDSLISIIVPVYKVQEYLDECVNSIVNQTYSNLEIILVDDGSPDACPLLCDNWAKKDRRIKVIHKRNGGLSSARNAGLEVASGDYIGFVDSDDFICKDAIYKLYNSINGKNDVGIVSGMIYRYQNGEIFPFMDKWLISEEKRLPADRIAIATLSQKASFTVWNKLYRKSVLTGVKFQEGHNNEDTLFMYDLGKSICNQNMCMLEIPCYVYYYRYRDDSICTTSKKPLAIDVLANYEYIMDDCKLVNVELYELMRKLYLKTLLSFVDSLLSNETWYSLYFHDYKQKLKEIPFSFVCKNMPFKSIVNIQLIKWIPIIRKIIQKKIKK